MLHLQHNLISDIFGVLLRDTDSDCKQCVPYDTVMIALVVKASLL